MCANFKKAFQKRETSIPNSILKQLEKDLPKGFYYKPNNDGACIMIPDDINKIIKKESFIISKELKDKSIDEILQYTYSSQQPLKFKNSIEIDSKIIKVEDMVKFPFSAEKISTSELVLLPIPFEVFTLQLECDNVKKIINVKRQASEDINKINIKSVDSSDLEFSYMMDLKEPKIDFNIDINFESCNSLEQLIENFKLYKAFGEGKLKVAGIDLGDRAHEFKTNINNDAVSDMIDFYQKLLEVTSLIDIKVIPKENISREDIYSLEELYTTLVKQKPYKENININKLNLKASKELDEDIFLGKKGAAFQSSGNFECNILGSTIVLPTIVVIYNIIVTKVNKEKSENIIDYDLDITNMEGKKIYKSCIHFKNKEEHDNYISTVDNIVEELSGAQELKIEV
ncbi:hypothetical protein CHL78_018405 [Romboutsia weinsteinii]|uniref:Uncharacterized protein n=1 Tax=Romboutsia weinsteinii TaxID=2020949 RepID=A0A371IY57_9FIRM|nr:abortive infection system toxin AbiGii family protein [Romboutsia weinsteinii]RDY25396.1 hypothetical protein CHL78_018405 [Romboutsia weinsteinii]